MKKDFRYNRIKNEWVHKDYPITIDNDEFQKITDDETEHIVNQRLIDTNKDISNIKKPTKKEKYLSPDELKVAFSNLRKELDLFESFKDFFMKKIQ
jgi:hypothetical protein